MFGVYFAAEPPSTYAQVMAADKDRFNRFFHAMLERGVYLAPSAFEAGFVSMAHDAAVIDATIGRRARGIRGHWRIGRRLAAVWPGTIAAARWTKITPCDTRRLLTPFLAAALLSLLTATAAAQSLPRFGAPDPHVKAELVAATDAIVPGQPLQLGLRLKHEKEWHTYWQVPGDSGLPTRIEWQLPAGITRRPDRVAPPASAAGRAAGELRLRGRDAAADHACRSRRT